MSGFNVADIWLGQNAPNAQPGNIQLLGFDTIRRINDRPSWIVLTRLVDGEVIQLPPQLVRLEVQQNPRESNELRDAMVSISKQYCVLIAVRDNPYMKDTDIQRADLFFFAGFEWEVIELINTIPGRLMVTAVVSP